MYQYGRFRAGTARYQSVDIASRIEGATPHQLVQIMYEELLKALDAMAFATADARGRPSVRIVLLRRAGPRGFGFFTNLDSRKGVELAENPHGALAIHWKTLRHQVRAEGRVEQVADEEADAYFASRGRDSQISTSSDDRG